MKMAVGNDGCEAVELRLIAGEKASDHPELAAHVGTCLSCFRTAADLREVPHLAALLRADDEREAGTVGMNPLALADPGEGFWATFPRTVSDARAASTRPAAGTSLWNRIGQWLRMPIPAAMAGAACAGMMALALSHGQGRPAGVAMAPSAPPTRSAAAGLATGGQEDLGLSSQGELDESVRSLDSVGLSALRAGLDRTMGGTAENAAPAAEQETAAAVGDSNMPTVSEELDMLDEAQLVALRDRMKHI